MSFVGLLRTTINERLDLFGTPHLRDERADLVLYLHEAAQTTLHNGGKVEQPQCVTGGGSVKDHH